MNRISTRLTLADVSCGHGLAQMNHTMVGEDTVKISDHVWAIMGFPNIAIVVGSRATLVVVTPVWVRKMEPPSPASWSLRP